MWYSKANIYHIFIDRFSGMCRRNDSDSEYMGGNIKGITDKIDYLEELGINCVWISPFFQNKAYHGYHITNYDEVDPHFGTTADVEELIHKLHSRNIKIITDFVPNHCSVDHPFFRAAVASKDSAYNNWFHFKKWPDDYSCFLNYKELPKFNLSNPETADYFIGNAKKWLGMGFDGLRIDHAIGPSCVFWEQFSREIKKEFPQAFVFGEAWTEGLKKNLYHTTDIPDKKAYRSNYVSQKQTQLSYSPYFNGVLDFELRKIFIKYFNSKSPNRNAFETEIQQHLQSYSESFLPIGFLDNHDTNRFSFQARRDKQKIMDAFATLLSLPIPIVLYYGTESNIPQPKSVHSSKPYSDLNARLNMNWDSIDYEYYDFFRELLQKRKD